MSPPPPRRILFVTHAFPPDSEAGVEVYTSRLAGELSARGHQICVATARSRPGLAQNSLVRETIDGLPVVGIVQNYPYRNLPEAVSDPSVARVFGALLDEFLPELVSVQTLANLGLGVLEECQNRDIPVVVHLHDGWWSCPSGGQRLHPDGSLCSPLPLERCGGCFDRYRHREGPLERASRRLAGELPGLLPPDSLHRAFLALPGSVQDGIKRLNELAARKQADNEGEVSTGGIDSRISDRNRQVDEQLSQVAAVFSPTRFLAESLARDGRPVGAAVVLPTGVPPGRESPRPASNGSLRVLFLGTWVSHKGPQVLADALALLPEDCPVEARAVGACPFPQFQSEVLARAKGLLRAEPVVPSARVPELLLWADVLVVPSLWAENAPLVVLEARAQGTPVLASDIGGLPELIEPGRDGLLFPPGDAATLARMLQEPEVLRQLAAQVQAPKALGAFAIEVEERYEEVLSCHRS